MPIAAIVRALLILGEAMRRRNFITLLGGAVAAWPFTARGQHPTIPVVGFLGGQTPELFASRLSAFRNGLAKSDRIEGRNVQIEYRWARGQDDRLPALAADLVHEDVAVIVTSSTSSAIAAKAATSTIPIVFAISSDPVQLGLVENLNRPGGNVTGSTSQGVEVGPKRLDVARVITIGEGDGFAHPPGQSALNNK
jgi:putative ABC transport system substrate-binding protein